MIKQLTFFALLLLVISNSLAQSESPYEWDWTKDGIWTGVAIGGTAVGYSLIVNKEDINPEEFARIQNNLQEEIDNINFIDRWAAGNNNEKAGEISDVPFALSFVAPFAMLFDDEINDHTGQYLGMYLESLATTGAMYTITAGLVNRSRPYVYDNSGETGLARRQSGNGQRSFYSGHVAVTATATFYMAKVYSDFNPDGSPTGKAFIWGGAAALPAAVGYFRMSAGEHFLTDVALGYVLGAATGILVPELHKKKMDGISIYTTGGQSPLGDDYTAMALRIAF
ncbi:phosphatase PAP2 family protein [Patiriisocius marinus]|uniref:phosphatase PAP2 family protein n=1 Tax=Patiriisocius marinus TaxID=1397112 RepID=UPI00232A8A61|nr:phosphatase PAP2 family protein [Patiriisocius marinus]